MPFNKNQEVWEDQVTRTVIAGLQFVQARIPIPPVRYSKEDFEYFGKWCCVRG
jgi:hypothetical protein